MGQPTKRFSNPNQETWLERDMFDPSIVQCRMDGIWRPKNTHGQVPPGTADAVAEVIGDHLYVACGYVDDAGLVGLTNSLYTLDLNTWVWSKLEPTGTRPLKSHSLASWVSGGKMFLFGGLCEEQEEGQHFPKCLKIQDWHGSKRTNQFVCYNPEDNSWNWPTSSGSTPPPVSNHAAFSVCGWYKDSNSSEKRFRSLAFLFGGRRKSQALNDIYYLDMETMMWECVPGGDTDPEVWPKPRLHHSLTCISSNTAVLVGGTTEVAKPYPHVFLLCRSRVAKDCWLLNIEASLSKENAKGAWSRCEHLESQGGWDMHQAVQDPTRKSLLLIGGRAKSGENGSESVRELSVCAHPLKVLAIESVARNVHVLASEIEEFPKKDALRLAVEAQVKKYAIAES